MNQCKTEVGNDCDLEGLPVFAFRIHGQYSCLYPLPHLKNAYI